MNYNDLENNEDLRKQGTEQLEGTKLCMLSIQHLNHSVISNLIFSSVGDLS